MININYKKGFTLIELLVVISIIGLLSSIVLASLNTTRVKAADAAIKADLKGVATSAEIEYTSLGYKYNTTGTPVTSTVCSTLNTPNTILRSSNIQSALKHIKSINGGQDVSCSISADGSTYSFTGPLSLSTGDSVYMDNTGIFVSGGSDSAIISSFYTYVLNNVCVIVLPCNTNLDFNSSGTITSADALILSSLSSATTQVYYDKIYNGLTAETNSKMGLNVTVGSTFDPDRSGTVTSFDLTRIQSALTNTRSK